MRFTLAAISCLEVCTAQFHMRQEKAVGLYPCFTVFLEPCQVHSKMQWEFEFSSPCPYSFTMTSVIPVVWARHRLLSTPCGRTSWWRPSETSVFPTHRILCGHQFAMFAFSPWSSIIEGPCGTTGLTLLRVELF